MQAIHPRHLIVWPIAATWLFFSGGAFADDNDPAAIEQRLKALETTPERQALVRDPASQARKALKRVLDARAAGDAAHAVQLATLANDWAKLAANVVKAAELEKDLAAQQTRLTDLEQKRRRTETLLEATIAQRERTREELNRSKVEKNSKEMSLSTPAKDVKTEAKKGSKADGEPKESRQPKATDQAKSTNAKAPAGTQPGAKPQGKP